MLRADRDAEAMSKRYTLHIDAYTPETIPLARLAQYMQSLAALLGHDASVHFERLLPGSTKLVTRIEHEDVPKVEMRISRVRAGEGTPDATRAQGELDRLLAEDNAAGFIYENDDMGAEIIAFPGNKRPRPISYGPFNQEGSLDGLLISVGGADQTVHVKLQNGNTTYTGIETNREIARRLAKHMYDPVRVFGTGRWLRDTEGNWTLKKFRIDHFDLLMGTDLATVVHHLRQIEGSDWKALPDPIQALRGLTGR